MTMQAPMPSAVLSIGRLYCDLIFTGLDSLPVLGREVFSSGMKLAAGGGAYIAAAHIHHVGRQVALVARLGSDALSREVATELASSGIDLRFVEHADDAGPQVTVAAVMGHDRAFLTKRAGSARPATLPAALDWSLAKHLHIAEYATLHEMPDLVREAKAKGLSVSLDPSWDSTLIYDKHLLEACEGVDLFLPNREEVEAITGLKDPEAALDRLLEIFPHVALKDGASGAWVAAKGFRLHHPAEPVPVIDTTGAGDAFNAGFLNAWLDDTPLEDCLHAGISAGSLAVQAAGGASTVRPDR
ncbi:carbohydrate kinase family protein [Rhizobium sp. SSA_523]|uniref:carbohydrate kinase family protein n=1 Tax=Rhizobium sp. SSA_523 TaxID=2952477 RepID=UPI002090BC74|nr:sugar kinase [Rhizobium sp. SSA_523]MCO5731211.1 sugar kinase [Rhizobium sp. SSA_523]WKC22247.1 sugar kinase [Rhizobium sp. SSA_523]